VLNRVEQAGEVPRRVRCRHRDHEYILSYALRIYVDVRLTLGNAAPGIAVPAGADPRAAAVPGSQSVPSNRALSDMRIFLFDGPGAGGCRPIFGSSDWARAPRRVPSPKD
jgi:hypothetical protein